MYTCVVEEKEIHILSYFLNERLSLSRARFNKAIDSNFNSFSLSFLHISPGAFRLKEESGRLKSPRRFFIKPGILKKAEREREKTTPERPLVVKKSSRRMIASLQTRAARVESIDFSERESDERLLYKNQEKEIPFLPASPTHT